MRARRNEPATRRSRLAGAEKDASDEAERLAKAEKKARDQAEKNEEAAKVHRSVRARSRAKKPPARTCSKRNKRSSRPRSPGRPGCGLSDPYQGKALLRNLKACPIQNRDFTWNLHYRMCERERMVYAADAPHVCATFSPDSKLLASGGSGGATHVWDFATGKLVRRFFLNPGRVYAVQFSRDAKTITTVESPGTIDQTWVHRWDLASGDLLSSKEFFVQIRGAALSPDSKSMATRNYLENPKPDNPSHRLHKGEGRPVEPGNRRARKISCATMSPASCM